MVAHRIRCSSLSHLDITPNTERVHPKRTRRIYDALNVLTAMDIITKDNKLIRWNGLEHAGRNAASDLAEDGTVAGVGEDAREAAQAIGMQVEQKRGAVETKRQMLEDLTLQ